jgi:hypothetical protein
MHSYGWMMLMITQVSEFSLRKAGRCSLTHFCQQRLRLSSSRFLTIQELSKLVACESTAMKYNPATMSFEEINLQKPGLRLKIQQHGCHLE